MSWICYFYYLANKIAHSTWGLIINLIFDMLKVFCWITNPLICNVFLYLIRPDLLKKMLSLYLIVLYHHISRTRMQLIGFCFPLKWIKEETSWQGSNYLATQVTLRRFFGIISLYRRCIHWTSSSYNNVR